MFKQAISGGQALQHAAKNTLKRWTGNALVKDALAAEKRIWLTDTARQIGLRPKFSIHHDQPVFTIGSCFARNVEEHLQASGFVVPTLELKVDPGCYNTPNVRSNAVLNRYSVHSMLNEVERTLGKVKPGNDGLIEVGADLYWDPQAAGVKPTTLADARNLRKRIDATNRRLLECGSIFITLGLTESWYDTKTCLVLNSAPLPRWMAREPDRYLFFNATPDEIRTALVSLIELLSSSLRSEPRIIITVSPVPMQATFTNVDVIVANTYSKAVLRSAAQVVANEFENVDYFPSYEMVMNSSRQDSWESDRLHVRSEIVSLVVASFQAAYISQMERAPTSELVRSH